jgi:predicted transcriptional regulator
MTILTRQEKERLVLDLYNQGKTYREIAKEARMCPRDIGVIVNKAVKEQELKTDHKNDKENQDTNNSAEKKLKDQGLSLSTRAYKLFSKGKALVEAAIALNLGEVEVTRYYKEYLKLKQLHGLYSAYEELEGEIEPFLKLYELSKAADMDTKQVVNLL